MYNDYTDLTENENEELNRFKLLFFDGFCIKKKCLLFGWVERVIHLSNDSSKIEWYSDKVYNVLNENILNKRFFYINNIKKIYRGDKENTTLLSNKITIIIEEHFENYIFDKKIIYDFEDIFLSNLFYNGLILLKKENDLKIYLQFNIPRDIRNKLLKNNN
jgi:hypothetical protein